MAASQYSRAPSPGCEKSIKWSPTWAPPRLCPLASHRPTRYCLQTRRQSKRFTTPATSSTDCSFFMAGRARSDAQPFRHAMLLHHGRINLRVCRDSIEQPAPVPQPPLINRGLFMVWRAESSSAPGMTAVLPELLRGLTRNSEVLALEPRHGQPVDAGFRFTTPTSKRAIRHSLKHRNSVKSQFTRLPSYSSISLSNSRFPKPLHRLF